MNSYFAEGKLHPLDLKNAVADYLIKFLEPARNHFKGKEKLFKAFKINNK